jgi:hypothetical protein
MMAEKEVISFAYPAPFPDERHQFFQGVTGLTALHLQRIHAVISHEMEG